MDTAPLRRRLVVAIYAHPEGYPPTLNALTQLANAFQDIELLYRPTLEECFAYPGNVRLHPSGERMSATRQMSLPVLQRYGLLLRFARDLAKLINEAPTDFVLVYDPLALLALRLAWPVLRSRPPIWYHNHDVIEPGQPRTFSLAWFATRAERRMWRHLAVFSLPARERERYFPMRALRGRYFFLPNLPTMQQIDRRPTGARDESTLRLLFQGRVSEGHGIEEIIRALPLRIAGRDVELVLAGWITKEFEQKLSEIAASCGAGRYVHLAGYRPYAQLYELTASCHVGIAVYREVNVMNASVGTASNKIYEYAASGLPILYLDTPHFREHLGKFPWAVAWDGTTLGLEAALATVVDQYALLSDAARAECRQSLNFERHFETVLAFLRLSS